MVTKDMLEHLRSQRSAAHARLELTINGPIKARVNSELDAQRERAISQGERTLRDALDAFRREQAFSSLNGLAKAQFNDNEELKP